MKEPWSIFNRGNPKLKLFFFFDLSIYNFEWKVRLCLVGGWKIMRGWKIRRIEKFWFSLVCLVGGVEKWESEKLFCLVGKKSGRTENVVYINWLLYLYYNKISKGLISVKKWEYLCNLLPISFFLLSFPLKFLSNWEDKILWARRENFSHHFLSLLFSLLNQIR